MIPSVVIQISALKQGSHRLREVAFIHLDSGSVNEAVGSRGASAAAAFVFVTCCFIGSGSGSGAPLSTGTLGRTFTRRPLAYSGPHRQDSFWCPMYYSSFPNNICTRRSRGSWAVWISPVGACPGRTYPSGCGQLALELSKVAVGNLWTNGFAVVHRLSIATGRRGTVHSPTN